MEVGRVLIIDDSPLQCKRMADILKKGGYNVFTATDGVAGFQVALTERPDMIISDVNMPDLDGIALCKALKEHSGTRSMPVVFLSNLDSMDDLVKGLEAGASDYLSKKGDGPEQILAMAEVHTAYAKRLKSTKHQDREDDSERALVREEFQGVHDLPASFFDDLSFGLVITNLRRQPIYVNSTGRQMLGFDPDVAVGSLGGEELDRFLATVAKAWQEHAGAFFFPVDWSNATVDVHLERVRNARHEICGVMLLVHF